MTEPKAYSYIRFSTAEQAKGDSLRRQLEQSKEYADKNNLILDDSIKLQDRGLSAFSGTHRKTGALGEFLKLVDQKKIPKGSILIVENLDRLSREQVLDALNQFTSIIKAGIKVVTLQDGMEYTKESINQNWAQLIISITYMARAHEESLTKSKRLKKAWANKRENVYRGGKKITGRCPAWLKLSEDKMSFNVIEERAEVIRRIFDMRIEGKGIGTIEKELNQSNDVWKPVSPRKNGIKGWRTSYINKILRNRSVLGEFQPHKKIEGKRQPYGELISDYYPPIVDKDIFDRVQLLIEQNKRLPGNAGGKLTKVNNLFTHLAKCSECGSSMILIDKGPKPKGGQYLICDRARRGIGCIKKNIKYEILEPMILSFCEGLDVKEILPNNEEKETELTIHRNRLQSVEGALSQIKGNLDNVLDSIGNTDNKELREVLENRASKMLTSKSELEKDKAELTIQIDRLVQADKSTEEQLKDIQGLIELMEEMEGKKRVDLRLKLREQLRSIITKIIVYTKHDINTVRCTLYLSTGHRRALRYKDGEITVMTLQPKKQELSSSNG